MTFEEVLQNRQKWAEFLMQPRRRKGTGQLDEGNGERCCIGHACYLLGAERKVCVSGYLYENERNIAPESIMQQLGMYDEIGGLPHESKEWNSPILEEYVIDNVTIGSLAELNDNTTITPREIGAYLLTVIKGGKNTPFMDKKQYERTYCVKKS